jgi:succinoglycan biosynthesis protein ExoA
MNVSAVMTILDEPTDRVERALASLAAQQESGPMEVIIAAPPRQHARLRALKTRGAVATVVLVGNPGGERSLGLNRAIAMASAPFIVRVDARSVLPPDYIAKCVSRLQRDPSVAVVGGVQRPRARSTAPRAAGIARALRNPWVLGGARYRRPGSQGPADTVYLGVFHRQELLDTPYDAMLAANEDYDLCARLRRAGRQVWLEHGLEVEYEARESYRALWSQYRSFGEAKVRYWRQTRERPSVRQALPLVGASATIVALLTQLAHPRRVAGLVIGGIATLVAIDHFADPRERRACVRAHSIVASACIVGAWVSGVAQEAARERLR